MSPNNLCQITIDMGKKLSFKLCVKLKMHERCVVHSVDGQEFAVFGFGLISIGKNRTFCTHP